MSTKARILVIDDSDFDGNLLAKAISRGGEFEVELVNSGAAGLRKLSDSKFDILFLDLVMPEMDGLQILQKIRESSSAIDLPVMMISANDETANVIEALKLGANDFISKPFNFEVVKSRIQLQLRLVQARRDQGKIERLTAVHAMIATYNHEINNPLTIALGALQIMNLSPEEERNRERIHTALWRIADMVKKIDDLRKKSQVDFDDYSERTKMIKFIK